MYRCCGPYILTGFLMSCRPIADRLGRTLCEFGSLTLTRPCASSDACNVAGTWSRPMVPNSDDDSGRLTWVTIQFSKMADTVPTL